jgi:hypothetical protein
MNKFVKRSDSCIRNLFRSHPEENSLSIEEFYNVIRKYNLKDAIKSIAEVSKKIYNDDGTLHHWRPFILYNSKKEVLTTMSMIGDLTYHFINSNANDKNNSLISRDAIANIVVLSGLCPYHLKYQIYSEEAFNPKNVWLMLSKEQGNIQLPIIPALSRNYLMFEKIVNDENFKTKRPNIPMELSSIFETNVGVKIIEYFWITFLLFVYIFYGNKISFNIGDIQSLEWEKDIITNEKISNVIKYLSCTYEQFRKMSKNGKFMNPLLAKPIIEFDYKRFDKYIIPNLSLFLEKCWNGLFYDIEALYKEKCGETCRGYFGYIFEEYVGTLLKYKFPQNKIWDEISYKKGTQKEFFDWVLELEKNESKEYYLIEVKSLEVPFAYIYEKKLDEYYKNTIIDYLRKAISKLPDIESIPELSFLKEQTYYPIFVFKDIPFINSNIMTDLLLSNILDPNEELYRLIKEQKIFIFNINDFENFVEILDKDNFNIVDLFKKQQEDQALSLWKIMQNIYGDTLLRNSLLEKTRNEIFEIIKVPEEIQKEN